MDEFNGATPAVDIVAYVDRLRASPGSGGNLVDLLAEQSAIYAGRATNEAERLRGYILASFESTGLPASAMAFVIEELESGLNPYAVAAAAKAARGANRLPEHIVPLLLGAIDRVRQSDDLVCFDSRTGAETGASSTTALMELFRTIALLGPRAGVALPALKAMLECNPPAFSPGVLVEIEKAIVAVSRVDQPTTRPCCSALRASNNAIPLAEMDIGSIELQDQDGAIFSFRDFFRGRPSVLTFFYTRCMNPNKCSLTITKLARLQQRILEVGLNGRVNIAAVTYDPAFDLPPRLRAYGTGRGMSFDDRSRLIRTTGSFEVLQRYFELGVGYGPSTVNQHRLELVILDQRVRPSASFTRVQWHEDDVFAALKVALAHP
jgi:cytochrome oxidase Cu insertion factor (SCO1/SenC/PrrC family)